MKRFLSLWTLLLCFLLGAVTEAQADNKTWNFSTWDKGDITATTTIDGLTVAASSGKKVSIDGNNKTFDGVSYTQRLKFGGAGDATNGRYIKFTVSSPSLITVLAMTASNGNARPLKIAEGDFDNIVKEKNVDALEAVKYFYEGTTEKDIYVYSGNSGINLYAVIVSDPVEEAIEISPASGDIYEALADASYGKIPTDITINLTAGAEYTISKSVVAPGNITVKGNGATIDASNLEEPMIQWVKIESPTGWTNADVVISGVTVKGLKNALFYSNGKNYWGDFTLDNSVIELAGDVTTFDYTKGSVAVNFKVTNSTIYAPTATTKALYSSQSGQKATEYAADAIQKFTFTNNTMYNLAPTKNFFSHRQSNQKWLAYDVKNNIFINCGKSGQVVKGLNGGQSGANPTWTIEGNIFNFNGADTSASESTGDAEEPVKESVAGIMIFNDPANGDFSGTFLNDGENQPENIGASTWTISTKEHYTTIWTSEEAETIVWDKANITIPAEKFADANIGDIIHITLQDVPTDAANVWDAQVAFRNQNWKELEAYIYVAGTSEASPNTDATFVITGDILSFLQASGAQINGQGCKTAKISLESVGKDLGSENSIWVGKKTATFAINKAHFANFSDFNGIKVGDAIRVTADKAGWLGLNYHNTSWTWSSFADGDITSINDYQSSEVTFVVNTEAAAKIINSDNQGIYINIGDAGQTVSQVELFPCWISDVAQMNALKDKTEFTFAGKAVVVAKVMKGKNAYVYIKDDKGSSLIYDAGGSKTANLEAGKTIKAPWTGKVSIYNQLFEVVPDDALEISDVAAEEITFEEIELADVKVENVNKVVKVKDVYVTDLNGSNFTTNKGKDTAVGYNQFAVALEEGLALDEVYAAIGNFKGAIQFQPIAFNVKAAEDITVNMTEGGDISDAIAAQKVGKNAKELTINLEKGDYTISKSIIANNKVTINGKGANIDASELTAPFIQMSKYPSVAANAKGGYEVGGVIVDEINVDNLSQDFFNCNVTKYLLDELTVNKSIIGIKGAVKKTIFNFNGSGNGNTKSLTVSGSTLYADDATEWQNGGFYSSQSGNGVNDLGGDSQKTTIEGSTFYNIAKDKTTSTRRRNSQNWMTYEVKNSLIVNSGKSGEFLKGLNGGNLNGGNWVVTNSSFTSGANATSKGTDVSDAEINDKDGKMEGLRNKGQATTDVVYGEPFFRKLWAADGTMTGDFTLGICLQIGKEVGDPRWYNIPMITKLNNALNQAAARLNNAQTDWQTADAENDAIAALAAAYNENKPYLNAYYQDEVDAATARVEAAIAAFDANSETTGINAASIQKADNAAWYTINGQRIARPTEKGIYIHNGRKVVIK